MTTNNIQLSDSSKKQSGLEKIVNRAIDVGFIGLAANYYFTSSLLTFAGFSVADLIMKKKNGEKLTARSIGKSLFDGAADSSTNAGVQEELYKGIEGIPNKTWLQKITKTLTWNPGVIMSYLPYYLGQQYVRNDIGYVKAIGGILNPKKGIRYLKDFYQTKIKGQYLSKVKSIFTKTFPIHFASMNYLTPENIGQRYLPARMGGAAAVDVIFATASKPDKNTKKEKH